MYWPLSHMSFFFIFSFFCIVSHNFAFLFIFSQNCNSCFKGSMYWPLSHMSFFSLFIFFHRILNFKLLVCQHFHFSQVFPFFPFFPFCPRLLHVSHWVSCGCTCFPACFTCSSVDVTYDVSASLAFWEGLVTSVLRLVTCVPQAPVNAHTPHPSSCCLACVESM